jgi:enediyne biosynthesis protein E3
MRQRLLGIAAAEASFVRRGFAAATPARQQRLEQVGRCFVAGYNAAVRCADPAAIGAELGAVSHELRGFAFEGAAMGFALLDLVAPWRSRRFAGFLAGLAGQHVYMAHVGAGWALARTSPHLAWRLGPLDPLLHWLMFDGYGFHAGYFRPRDAIDRQHQPGALHGYARNVFDQGLGRAMWFARGADVQAVADAAADFPEPRHADLWSGIGLAAAYAGGAEADDLRALAAASGRYRAHLAQGAAFAAKARERAGNPAPHTEFACRTLCGMAATAAAAITDQALPVVGPGDRGEAYQAWRAAIRRRIGVHVAEAAS